MIGVLIFPDFQLLDAAGPVSAFEIAGRLTGRRADIRPLALVARPVRSLSGVEMLARSTKSAGALDTLIVAGGEGTRQVVLSEPTIAFVRSAARRARRI